LRFLSAKPPYFENQGAWQMVEELLKGNSEFQKAVRENPAVFEKLAKGQNPVAVWIGCADSRAQPNVVTRAGSGMVFAYASVANAVPDDYEVVEATLEYGQLGLKNPGGKPPAVVVCGHYGCGGIRELVEKHHPEMRGLHSFLERSVGPAKKILDRALKGKGIELGQSDYLDALAEANALLQARKVQKHWAVEKAGSAVRAWMLDLKTGAINTEMRELKKHGLFEAVRGMVGKAVE